MKNKSTKKSLRSILLPDHFKIQNPHYKSPITNDILYTEAEQNVFKIHNHNIV